MYGIGYYTAALFEFMLSLQFMQYLFVCGYPRGEHILRRVLLGELLYILSGAVMMYLFFKGFFSEYAILMYILAFLCSFGVLKYVRQLDTIDALFGSTCGYAAQHIGSALGNLVQYFTKMGDRIIWLRFPVGILIQACVGFLFYWLVIRRHLYDGRQKEKDIRVVSLAVIVLFATIFLSVWSDSHAGSTDAGALLLGRVICKLYAILLCILVIAMQYMISHMNQMDHQKEIMEQMIHAQAEQQKLSNESVAIINRKCHDLKYQIRALKYEQNEEKRSASIDEIREAISIYDSVYHTGNEALNMLLREKTLLCEEHEIQFSCMANGECLNFMSTDDLYVLLGNAFDNAIESVLKERELDKRIISLTVTNRQNMVYIHLENYCSRELIFEHGLPVTTKEDKHYHGFGTQSIQYITEKYNGTEVMQQIDGMFCLDILLPIIAKKEN